MKGKTKRPLSEVSFIPLQTPVNVQAGLREGLLFSFDEYWQLLPRSEPVNSLYLWSRCTKPLGFEGRGLRESTAPFLRCLKSQGDFQTVLVLRKKGRDPRSMQRKSWEILGFSFSLLWVCVTKYFNARSRQE